MKYRPTVERLHGDTKRFMYKIKSELERVRSSMYRRKIELYGKEDEVALAKILKDEEFLSLYILEGKLDNLHKTLMLSVHSLSPFHFENSLKDYYSEED